MKLKRFVQIHTKILLLTAIFHTTSIRLGHCETFATANHTSNNSSTIISNLPHSILNAPAEETHKNISLNFPVGIEIAASKPTVFSASTDSNVQVIREKNAVPPADNAAKSEKTGSDKPQGGNAFQPLHETNTTSSLQQKLDHDEDNNVPFGGNFTARGKRAKLKTSDGPVASQVASQQQTSTAAEQQARRRRQQSARGGKSYGKAKWRQQQQQRVGVLMPSHILDKMHVQQGFLNFVDFFQVSLKNVSVDFIRDDDLSGFIKLLEHPKYTTVIKTLNAGINVDDDLIPVDGDGGGGQNTEPSARAPHKKFKKFSSPTSWWRYHDAAVIGYCHLAEELSTDFNKSVLMWPCPRMKASSNFLPSFEAISYAVQSIATKLNWTQVDIFVGDENWALPLAIAANLHIPYKIDIGESIHVRDLHAQDKYGKAVIVTADMKDDSTLSLLTKLEMLQHTKILLIDIVASSFNAENRFYKHLARIKASSELMQNLLLLTVLSDKYRHFLNVAFEDNGMEMVQNFRQLRLWKAMSTNFTYAMATGSATEAADTHDVLHNWPMHLDSFVTNALLNQYGQHNATTAAPSTTTTPSNERYTLFTECPYLNASVHRNFVNLCQNYEAIASNCGRFLTESNVRKRLRAESETEITKELMGILKNLCRIQSTMQLTNATYEKIMNLRNFIDFFNFYDFLIANLMRAPQATGNTTARDDANANVSVPKYDFIVLDVVRDAALIDGQGVTLTSTANGSVSAPNDNNNGSGFVDGGGGGSATGNGDTFKWRPLLILEQHEINLNTYITHSIQPGYDDWLLVRTSQLWQCGAICWTIIAICVGILLIIVAASVAAGIAVRNYFLRKRLSKGPNKIVLSSNDFVFPVDSRRVDEGIEAMLCCWLQQLQEFGGPEIDKPDLLKGSIGSLKNLGLLIPGANNCNTTTANGKTSGSGSASLARHNPAFLDMRARYNGDLVQLKEVPMTGSIELKAKAMDLLVMAHGLRHENVNPLIGWLSDPSRTAMVFDYCSRGSLQDVLIMDEIKLDWSFRLSLLTDLVRGMRYLHTSAMRVHGSLSSRNCVVDARWVLKITDYGVATFYEAQGLTPPSRSAKELLWTAPELLRSMKPHNHHHSRMLATQMGDVYSFGIIMQEVVVRGEPYCMLSLSPEEIIAKIKKPPPLIRPSVSKGAAPPEAINIMRQCWAEQPEMRPDFNSVYERFKMLNHGRKVNFVDTMFQMLEKYSNNLEELIRERTEQLDIERKKTEQLLNRMLPSSVAEKLKMGLAVDPEEFSDVTIYFSDIVGFTTIAAHCSPVQVVDLLNDLYTIFDATINAYNVYKVETIGDAYMVVSGVPVKIPDHAEQIATMALDLLHQSGRFNVKHLPGVPLQLRIGLHTGPCCAGVVGLTMPRYCLFGDTVNTASRMESTGSSWRIHMSQETRDRLEARGGYTIEPRGLIDIKGKGMMNTFWLLGKKGFEKPLPVPPPIGESHGLDESLIRNSITQKAQANKSRPSTNPSSSQSSSLAGESVEVKVEITPPANNEIGTSPLPNSYSLDSNSTTTISPNMTLCPEFPSKTPSTSPQSRKMSELTPADTLLNPNNFNRLPNSTAGSSSRLYKKIEEMMDLSLPYNHYKCLSPSESNLTQFYDGKYLYAGGVGMSIVGGMSGTSVSSSGPSTTGSVTKFDTKPGSSRLLRRQFSLDRDDTHSKAEQQHQQHHQCSLQATHAMSLTAKSTTLEIPVLHDTTRSPKNVMPARSLPHKQNSTSIAQDLEKIEEIPLSPASSQHHSSMDSNLNRSPPSSVEARTPTTLSGSFGSGQHHLPHTASHKKLTVSPPVSAPTTPAPQRATTLNGGLTERRVDSKETADSQVVVVVDGNARDEEKEPQTELTLNVEALLSR